jgi:pyruvate dehydrogenase (quinone)
VHRADTVGDFVLRRLRERGVEQVFACPGNGINGLVTAFRRSGDLPSARHWSGARPPR